MSPGDGAPGFEPLPAGGQRADAGPVPSETVSTSFMEKRVGSSAL